MRTAGLIVVGVLLSPLGRAAAQPPELKLGEPVVTWKRAAPDLEPVNLPRRPARLKFRATSPLASLYDLKLVESRQPAPDHPPPKLNELFDYLSDTAGGDGQAPGRLAADRRPVLGEPRASDGRAVGTRLVGDSGGWFSGERMQQIFGRKDGGLFRSDHAFDQFTSPISNPFLFEDPRSLTEIRGLFLYQTIPGAQPNFQGGNAYFGGAQARVALTERFSVAMTKLGGVGVNPDSQALFQDSTGLSELWIGPKYTFYRDPAFQAVAAGGVQFQVPLGGSGVFQDTGTLSVVPYLSAGKTLVNSRIGGLNVLANTGYAFSVNNRRSDYFYASAQLSVDVMNKQKLFPVIEANWFQVTKDARSRAIPGEGRDLFNFGGQASGSQLLTGSVGLRWRITPSLELGGAYEFPVLGNRDFLDNRFLIDLSYRY